MRDGCHGANKSICLSMFIACTAAHQSCHEAVEMRNGQKMTLVWICCGDCAVLLPNSTASGKARFSNFHEVLPLCPVLRKFVR